MSVDHAAAPPPRLAPGAADRRLAAALAVARAVLNATAAVSPGLAGRLALPLWRRPGRPRRVRSVERVVHEAARVSSVEHGGRPVVTYAWGDGRRPVVLVHGWQSRASRYAALVRLLLDRGFSPVSYDAPGHGASEGDAATVLGHQAIIGALAERHGRFEGMIAHSLGVPFALYAVRQGLAVPRVVAISGMGRFGYLVDTFCDQLGLSRSVGAGLRRAIERSLFDGDRDIWEKFSPDVPADCDVLVVHDAGDEVVDVGQAALVVAAYGDRATYLETAGLRHHEILGDPAVLDAVADFLDTEVGAR